MNERKNATYGGMTNWDTYTVRDWVLSSEVICLNASLCKNADELMEFVDEECPLKNIVLENVDFQEIIDSFLP